MKKWNKIEYFHPDGKSMPNGINYQRGWFSKECRDNMEAFLPVSPETSGILVFPSQEMVGLSSGMNHVFTGRFMHNDVIFDNSSATIEIKASTTYKTRKIATRFCESHGIQNAILKVFPLRSWYNISFDKAPKFYNYKS